MPFTFRYARVSTDGLTLAAEFAELEAAGAGKVFREKVSGAKRDRPQLARLLASPSLGDVVLVSRLDRLARSTRDLLNVLDWVAAQEPSSASARAWLGPARTDTAPAPLHRVDPFYG